MINGRGDHLPHLRRGRAVDRPHPTPCNHAAARRSVDRVAGTPVPRWHRFNARFIRGAFAPGIDKAVLFGPRGLGKSSLSGELLAAALFEAGGESILLAGSLDQARPSSGSCGPRMTVPTSGIWTPGSAWPLRTFPTHTRVQVASSDAKARVRVRGRAARLIVGDEPASWQERGGALMYDALETSGGKNETTLTDRYPGLRLRRKAGGAHLLTTKTTPRRTSRFTRDRPPAKAGQWRGTRGARYAGRIRYSTSTRIWRRSCAARGGRLASPKTRGAGSSATRLNPAARGRPVRAAHGRCVEGCRAAPRGGRRRRADRRARRRLFAGVVYRGPAVALGTARRPGGRSRRARPGRPGSEGREGRRRLPAVRADAGLLTVWTPAVESSAPRPWLACSSTGART